VIQEQLRLMAVHAHPDDESSKGAATMARYVDEGVDVLVVTCTGGERGSILNPAMDRPEVLANMPEIRKAEMEKARQILGVRQEWLGFVDSGLPEGDPTPPLPEGCFGLVDPEVGAAPLVAAIRRQRPHVVLTYDENGGYPHPDHIMTHKISMVAFDSAGDPDRYPEAGEPWQPLKLYYHMSFGRARMAQMHEALLAAGLESPYGEWLKEWDGEDTVTERITTRIECAEWFPRRDDALVAHATQIDPTSRWFAVPLQLRQQITPTEDYELARSLLDTDLPEDDLFAGVRETISA
jgi:mycothiol S-conjugate amidase